MLTDLFQFETPIDPVYSSQNFSFWIKRDDRINLTFGTKVRKFKGVFDFFLTNKFQTAVISGNLHANYTAVFSYLFSLAKIPTIVVAQSRNKERITANSLLVEQTADTLHLVVTREERERMCRQFGEKKGYFLLPDYGFHESAMEGMHSLWEEIQSEEFDTLVLDIGSGLTLLSLYHWFKKKNKSISFRILGIAIGKRKEKLQIELLQWAQKFALEISHLDLIDPLIDVGYGRYSRELEQWILSFYDKTGILLEPVYSGKSLYTMEKRAEQLHLQGKYLYLHQGGQLNFIDTIEGMA